MFDKHGVWHEPMDRQPDDPGLTQSKNCEMTEEEFTRYYMLMKNATPTWGTAFQIAPDDASRAYANYQGWAVQKVAADQLIEAEMALLTRESVATGATPPTHQGPDGPSRGLGWIALAGFAASLIVLGLLWLAYKTVTTFWEVLP